MHTDLQAQREHQHRFASEPHPLSFGKSNSCIAQIRLSNIALSTNMCRRDGIKTEAGWLKGDDAWLVMDRNGYRSVDTRSELFGVDTAVTVTETPDGGATAITYTRKAATGVEAQRALDVNKDSVFNASDAAFALVKLWQDTNQDGVSQATELFTLGSKGITAISLNASTATTNLGNGNTVTGQATVTRSNGTTTLVDSVDLQASNLNLASNPFYRKFTDRIPLTEQVFRDMESGAPAVRGNSFLKAHPIPNTLAGY